MLLGPGRPHGGNKSPLIKLNMSENCSGFPKFRDNAAATKRVSRNLITLNHQAADLSFFSILALRRLVDDSMGPSKGLTFEGNNNFIGPRIIVVVCIVVTHILCGSLVCISLYLPNK